MAPKKNTKPAAVAAAPKKKFKKTRKQSRMGKMLDLVIGLVRRNDAANGIRPNTSFAGVNAFLKKQVDCGATGTNLNNMASGATAYTQVVGDTVYTTEVIPPVFAQTVNGVAVQVQPEFTAVVPSQAMTIFIRGLCRSDIWSKINGSVAFVNHIVAILRVCPLLRAPGTERFARGLEDNAAQTMASMIAVAVDDYQGSQSDEYDYKNDTTMISEYLSAPRTLAQKTKFVRCRPLSTFIYTVSTILLAGYFTIRKNVDAASSSRPNALGEAVRATFKNLFAVGLALIDDTAGYLQILMGESFINTSRKALANGTGFTTSTSKDDAPAPAIPDDARAEALIGKSNVYLTLWRVAQQAEQAVMEDASPAPQVHATPSPPPKSGPSVSQGNLQGTQLQWNMPVVPPTVAPAPGTSGSVAPTQSSQGRGRGKNFEKNRARRLRKGAGPARAGATTANSSLGPLLPTPVGNTPAAGVAAAAHVGKKGKFNRRWN